MNNLGNLGNAYLDEIKWFIECFLDDKYNQSEDKEILLKLKDEDLKDVVYKMLDDSELNECLNSTIKYYLFHYKKLEHKKENSLINYDNQVDKIISSLKKEKYNQLLNSLLGDFKDSMDRGSED